MIEPARGGAVPAAPAIAVATLVLALVGTALLGPALVGIAPTAAQDLPDDTIAVVKADESPSNAEIAVRLSEETPFSAVDTVVIGRDDTFADSLASGVLQSESPLLLVPSAGPLPPRVRDELARLAPTRVILLGGEAALQPAVADELTQLGYTVERRAGESRVATATPIAATDAPQATTAILARAFPSEGATDPTQGFADALAAGGMSAENGWPVLLTQTDVLSAPTRAYLEQAGITQVEIMGGTAAISDAVEAELEAMGITTERLAGASRADTAIAVAEKRGADSAADAAHVVLVQGQTADAWAGGFAAAAHSALLDAPIVLAAESELPPETAAWLADGVTGGSATFAVDPSDGPVLTCVTVPSLCEEARVTLGLPPSGPVTFSPAPGTTVDAGQPIRATFTTPVGRVRYGGTCVTEEGVTPRDAGTTMLLAVDAGVPAGACTFELVLTPSGGAEQVVEVDYTASGDTAVELLSRTPAGPSGGGWAPSASADGTVVAFTSDGPLVEGVTAGAWHAYVERDGQLVLLDVTSDGTPGVATGQVLDTFVAADGGHVAFTSTDGALDPAGAVEAQIITYLRDLDAGTTTHVSVDVTGTPVLRGERPSVNADGTVVTYTGQGETGVSTGCACTWMWVHDLAAGAVHAIADAQGQPIQAGASRPQVSADGSTVVFQTSTALVAEDDNDGADVYAYDVAGRTLELVSVAADGTAGGPADVNPNAETGISADGRFVAFGYSAGDLLEGESADRLQVYLRDREAGTTTRLTPAVTGLSNVLNGKPQVSEDGAWVAFTSERPEIAASQGGCGVYRYEVATGELDRVDLGAVEAATNCPSRVDVALDGSVVFDHFATQHVDDVDHGHAYAGNDVHRAAPPQG
ncbi:cell wall-binding repeat-containing protein [Euzebya sp.]|uniref:cell wall-binding repeat-containing protein n=1 Tax=Euzebya sp. TaxID=1971409 RepID=UPI0035113B62